MMTAMRAATTLLARCADLARRRRHAALARRNIPGGSTSLPEDVPPGNAPPGPPRAGSEAPQALPTAFVKSARPGRAATGPRRRSVPSHHYVFALFALDN